MILLFDSSSMEVRLVIITDTSERIVYSWEAGRTLARNMLTFITDKLRENNLELASVQGIGVFRGPGSYTGLRIGLTVLNTLADSMGIPIVGAVSDEWETICRQRLQGSESDGVVLPEYGGEAHVTAPRK